MFAMRTSSEPMRPVALQSGPMCKHHAPPSLVRSFGSRVCSFPHRARLLRYMFLANLLQWPAGSVPVSTVRPGEAHYHHVPNPSSSSSPQPSPSPPGVAPLRAGEHDSIARLSAAAMAGSAGLPVGVQVMAPMHKDEVCLRVMRLVEDSVAQQPPPPSAGLLVP